MADRLPGGPARPRACALCRRGGPGAGGSGLPARPAGRGAAGPAPHVAAGRGACGDGPGPGGAAAPFRRSVCEREPARCAGVCLLSQAGRSGKGDPGPPWLLPGEPLPAPPPLPPKQTRCPRNRKPNQNLCKTKQKRAYLVLTGVSFFFLITVFIFFPLLSFPFFLPPCSCRVCRTRGWISRKPIRIDALPWGLQPEKETLKC